MIKIATIVGARPQFIKSSPVTRAIRNRFSLRCEEVLIHTGQHYDKNMSEVFFKELDLAVPKYNLRISGGRHGAMTGRMLESIEFVLLEEKPDWVLVYGDTNSTLAAALAAAKLHIPVAHVEAGLRSFNMRMPEEVNRIVADRLSTLLFCPTAQAVFNLKNEGFETNVHQIGDVMYDAAKYYFDIAEQRTQVMSRLGLERRRYVLVTCHREENTDYRDRLADVLTASARLSASRQVVLPLHPRTKHRIEEFRLSAALGRIKVTEPLSYLEMLSLEANAEVIVTDSGGVQKEAFFFRTPCITIRSETEWVETVDSGWNVIIGTDQERIVHEVECHQKRVTSAAEPYGTGDAAIRMLDILLAS